MVTTRGQQRARGPTQVWLGWALCVLSVARRLGVEILCYRLWDIDRLVAVGRVAGGVDQVNATHRVVVASLIARRSSWRW
jgi:hypothetical protein